LHLIQTLETFVINLLNILQAGAQRRLAVSDIWHRGLLTIQPPAGRLLLLLSVLPLPVRLPILLLLHHLRPLTTLQIAPDSRQYPGSLGTAGGGGIEREYMTEKEEGKEGRGNIDGDERGGEC
jgi:hypothetical protein